METHFASPERLTGDQLESEVEIVSKNAIVDELLHSVGGVLAVLNKHRQILALNDALLDMLGITDPEKVLGLRPGEALRCIHSCEMPGGCGTSEFCATCGAVISIVSCLTTGRTEEGKCSLTIEKDGVRHDLYFRVRCSPVDYNSKRYLLLFLQDTTYHQRLAALERVFFHDINNIITGILNGNYMLARMAKELGLDKTFQGMSDMTYRLSTRLANEIKMQRSISQTNAHAYQPTYDSVSLADVMLEIRDTFANNPVSHNKSLTITNETPDLSLRTDFSLLMRVLGNMVTNAFEETAEGDKVKVWVEPTHEEVSFNVWNRKVIPHDVEKRIFQRNFSTKAETGRGYGTYSMKFFGEEILGGKVDFSTSDTEGTVFRFTVKR
jgi:uncharacterized protein YejL (UPF0352 family)